MYYRKPVLENLSLGKRLKFIREHRHMRKGDVAEYFGFGGGDPTQTIRKYENNSRKPDKERIKDYEKLYEVSSYALKEYDFKDPIDIIYVQMWMEEEFPNYECIINLNKFAESAYNMNVQNGLCEWSKMREKRLKNEITVEEYIDWKLNYKVTNYIK